MSHQDRTENKRVSLQNVRDRIKQQLVQLMLYKTKCQAIIVAEENRSNSSIRIFIYIYIHILLWKGQAEESINTMHIFIWYFKSMKRSETDLFPDITVTGNFLRKLKRVRKFHELVEWLR